MKMFVFLLLHFVGLLGFIGYGLLAIYRPFPERWYIEIPLFIISVRWAFFMNNVAQNYRDNN
jgi:hypothetical protein